MAEIDEVRVRLCTLRDDHFGGIEAEMARRTGIARPTLHNILSGKTKAITADQILAVLQTTGTSADWLLFGSEPRFRIEQEQKAQNRMPDVADLVTRWRGEEDSVQPVPDPERIITPFLALEAGGRKMLEISLITQGSTEAITIPIQITGLGDGNTDMQGD